MAVSPIAESAETQLTSLNLQGAAETQISKFDSDCFSEVHNHMSASHCCLPTGPLSDYLSPISPTLQPAIFPRVISSHPHLLPQTHSGM